MSVYDPSKYTDVMLDLETLGTAPGSVIISIGAAMFAEGMPEAEWAEYDSGPIGVLSSVSIGLRVNGPTLIWWAEQVREARRVFDEAWDTRSTLFTKSIIAALNEFTAFYPPGARLWSNGANFDGVLLREAYRQAGLNAPWSFRDEQCYRTMKTRYRTAVPASEFQGVRHSALDDARHQARHLQLIWSRMRRAEEALAREEAECRTT